MFCYSSSPFFNLDSVSGSEKNELLRCMKYIVYLIVKDNLPDCTILRNFLPVGIRYGQQDVSETYDIFMKNLGFEPITIYTEKHYKRESGEIRKNKPTKQMLPYITIWNNGESDYSIVDNIFKGEWEDLGSDSSNWVKPEEKETSKVGYRFIKTSITKMKGDCVVFVINRSNPSGVKYTNNVHIPDYIEIGGNKYFRFSVILHISNGSIHHGHYISVLWNLEEYYIFDDMNTGVISKYTIDYDRQKELTRKNSVMVFFYPLSRRDANK